MEKEEKIIFDISAYGKKLILHYPEDMDADDLECVFVTITEFLTFDKTLLKEMFKEEDDETL